MKIAIASGKGGTGKTTLAVNLGVLLSKNQRLFSNVVLVDLDVEEPNSGLFLNGELIHEEVAFRPVPQWNEDTCTFCGKCTSICHFNALAALPKTILVFNELCHSCYACSELCPTNSLPMHNVRMGTVREFSINERLIFVEGILDVGQESAVPLIKQTKKFANKQLNGNVLFLLDSPPGTSCPVIEASRDADFVILVTEPTPFGLHDLKLAVETMRALQKPMGVIINRYGIGNDGVESFCMENNIKILGKIPYLKEVAELYSKGLLLDQNVIIKEALENIINELFLLTSINTK